MLERVTDVSAEHESIPGGHLANPDGPITEGIGQCRCSDDLLRWSVLPKPQGHFEFNRHCDMSFDLGAGAAATIPPPCYYTRQSDSGKT